MPNHVIRDRIWSSGKLERCSKEAALAYPWIFLVADDHGRFEFHPQDIWGVVFRRRKDVTPDDVERWLGEYEREKLLERYGNGLQLAFWTNFQGRPPSKRRPSIYPDPKPLRRVPNRKRPGTVRVPSSRAVAEQESRAGEQSAAEQEERSAAEQPSAEPEPSPHGNGALAKDAYFAEVWSVFRHVTGQERLVPSSQEGDVIMRWHRDQIPLRSVVTTLEETDRARAREVRSLAYFDPVVREHDTKRRRMVGAGGQ